MRDNKSTPKPNTDPGGLDDLSAQKSDIGSAIPKPYGRARFATNIIWAPPLREKVKTKKQGKGGGGTTKEYTVFGTFACLLCDGQIDSLKRVWFNNKLVYDKYSTKPKVVSANTKFETKYLELYKGTLNQSPSPTIQSYETVANTPAFRGRTYIVIRDFPLKDYGNRLPRVEVEVLERPVPFPVSQTVIDACSRVGIPASDIDATAIADIMMIGATLTQDGSSVRNFIEELQRIYNFTAIEQDGKVRFEKTTKTVSLAIQEAFLGARNVGSEMGEIYKETRDPEYELPSEVQVEFKNVNNSMLKGMQYELMPGVIHDNTLNFRTSLAIDDSIAKTVAARSLKLAWTQRHKIGGLSLPPSYIGRIKPNDVITVNIHNTTYTVQVESVEIGADYRLVVNSVRYNDAAYTTIEVVDDLVYSPPEEPKFYDEVDVIAYDTNLIRYNDFDNGVYVGIYPRAEFDAVSVAVKEQGGEYEFGDTYFIETSRGTVSSGTIPARSQYIIDETTEINVTLTTGVLENVTEQDFLNGKQIGLFGNELIAFQNAVQTGANTYTISRLLRGVRGTEWAIASHTANEQFVLMTGDYGASRLNGELDNLNKTMFFKGVNIEETIQETENESSLFINGNSLKPFAPTLPTASRRTSDNTVILGWTRRDRRASEWNNGIEKPLSEITERYDLEIIKNGVIIRTISNLTSPSFEYTQAMRVSDGTGNDLFNFNVYQRSSVVGRGYKLYARNVKINFSI